MAEGTYPQDAQEEHECRRAPAAAGCHGTPIHALKTNGHAGMAVLSVFPRTAGKALYRFLDF